MYKRTQEDSRSFHFVLPHRSLKTDRPTTTTTNFKLLSSRETTTHRQPLKNFDGKSLPCVYFILFHLMLINIYFGIIHSRTLLTNSAVAAETSS